MVVLGRVGVVVVAGLLLLLRAEAGGGRVERGGMLRAGACTLMSWVSSLRVMAM